MKKTRFQNFTLLRGWVKTPMSNIKLKTKTLVDYPIDYTVSSDGTIRSIYTGRTLKVQVGKQNQLKISTTKDNKPVRLLVACEVLKAFVRLPERGEVIIYIDGDFTNCSLSNLRWGTRSEKHRLTISDKIK